MLTGRKITERQTEKFQTATSGVQPRRRFNAEYISNFLAESMACKGKIIIKSK